tara:strand:- start:459 stop:746 length:288 start_codon:yes stop_codon:yes gene_type:complete
LKEKLNSIYFDTIDELNDLLDQDNKLGKNVEEIIFGESSKLDSLGVINFMTIIEQKIDNEFNINDFSLFDLISDNQISSGSELIKAINNSIENNG